MIDIKMNAPESRVSSLQILQDANDPTGVSALVSRLNCAGTGSDAASRTSSESEGCGAEEHRQEKTFLWLAGFHKQCRLSLGSKSVKQLDNLLTLYIEHVTPHYRDSHKLPNKAAKLKRNINETLIFFHMLYMDIREPLESGFYHDKMTELLAMYLDLEITASRRGKDTDKTVTNKLSTTLYTFLDHSEDHILDALLKTKLINKHSKKVSVPLLRKILSELVVRRPLSELTYVRFLLSFKLWKNVVADAEERRSINKLAAQRLHPPPEFFQDHDIAKPGAEVLPRVPKTKKNCTTFYIQAKFNLKEACRAFFRYCKDNCRSNVYRRNLTSSEDMEKPFLLSARQSAEKNIEAEEGGSWSLINDIWSTVSNDDPGTALFGESDMFSEVRVEENSDSLSYDSMRRKKKPQDSPDSGLGISVDSSDRTRRKENKKKKESNVLPDNKFVMSKNEQVSDLVPQVSPAKGVQDCCLGSVLLVSGGQGRVKAEPGEAELPTSSRQHSVLESLGYAQPGSDNEAVPSSASPESGSVPSSHLDTNECDSSVEILQSRQGATEVRCTLPMELKSELNMDEDLRNGKAVKEELSLLFRENDPVGEGCFESPFSDLNQMFRINEDLFACRNSFGELDQASMIYRRTDVTGSLPFQGNPLLEEDEDEFSRGFRWSSVPEFSSSVQSTIINQSSGHAATGDLVSCYASPTEQEDREEPKLGQEGKQGKGATPGLRRHGRRASRRRCEHATIDSTCGGVLADLGLASTAIGQSDLVDLGLEDLGLEKALIAGLDDDLSGDFDVSSGEDENIADANVKIMEPSTTPPKCPSSDSRRGRPPKRRGPTVTETAVASTTTSTPTNTAVVPKKPRQKATSICALPLTRSIADAVGIRLPDPIKEMVSNMRKQQSKKSAL